MAPTEEVGAIVMFKWVWSPRVRSTRRAGQRATSPPRGRPTTGPGPRWISFDVRQDLASAGCVVCRGASRTAWRYLESLLWEHVTDPGVRFGLRSSHGFCREHVWMVIAVASANAGELGLAIIAEDLLEHVRGDVDRCAAEIAGARRWKHTTGGAISATAPCVACQVAGRTTLSYLRELCREDRVPEIVEMALDGAPHLCLPHVNVGLDEASSKDEARRLIEIYRAGEATLRGQLSEFIRKRDYRFQDERTTADEADAYARAMRSLVGDRPGSGRSTRSEPRSKEVER